MEIGKISNSFLSCGFKGRTFSKAGKVLYIMHKNFVECNGFLFANASEKKYNGKRNFLHTMQSIDMFFPRDLFPPSFERLVRLPEKKPEGKAFSPHIVELSIFSTKEKVMNEKKSSLKIASELASPTPLDFLKEKPQSEMDRLFLNKKTEKKEDEIFGVHTIDDADQKAPEAEIQRKRTKKLIQKEDDIWKALSAPRSSQNQFFRNVRDMLS